MTMLEEKDRVTYEAETRKSQERKERSRHVDPRLESREGM